MIGRRRPDPVSRTPNGWPAVSAFSEFLLTAVAVALLAGVAQVALLKHLGLPASLYAMFRRRSQ